MHFDHAPAVLVPREHGERRDPGGSPRREPAGSNHHRSAGEIDSERFGAEGSVRSDVDEGAASQRVPYPVEAGCSGLRVSVGQADGLARRERALPSSIARRGFETACKTYRITQRL